MSSARLPCWWKFNKRFTGLLLPPQVFWFYFLAISESIPRDYTVCKKLGRHVKLIFYFIRFCDKLLSAFWVSSLLFSCESYFIYSYETMKRGNWNHMGRFKVDIKKIKWKSNFFINSTGDSCGYFSEEKYSCVKNPLKGKSCWVEKNK